MGDKNSVFYFICCKYIFLFPQNFHMCIFSYLYFISFPCDIATLFFPDTPFLSHSFIIYNAVSRFVFSGLQGIAEKNTKKYKKISFNSFILLSFCIHRRKVFSDKYTPCNYNFISHNFQLFLL